ncbi:MAG: DUF4386 domain-containing protein [Proteobacteria bacterium]|nr:DUF4386 domain-containing protein [Pseudomonadota bacterium]
MTTIDLLQTHEERKVLRWGGLAGVLGGVLLVVVFVIVGAFVGTFAGPDAEVAAYPDVRVARTFENGLYLLVLVLWVAHFIALYRALRKTSPAPALYGAGMGIISMVVLAAGALPHVVTAPISDLYHAPGATPEEQAGLVVAWQAAQGVIDALLIVGLVIAPIGLVLLGVAMARTPAFGRVLGRVTLGLGVAGAAAAVVALAIPDSPVAAVGIFALIAFQLVVGRRTFRLPTRELDG